MRRAAEVLVFGLLALVVHIALFLARSEPGAEAGGAGGETIVSIEAAEPTIVEMVEAWETQAQPVLQTDLAMDQPSTPEDAPPPPSIELAEAPNADLQVARIATPDREALELSIEQFNRRPVQVEPQLDAITPQAPALQSAPDLSTQELSRPDLAQPQMAAMQVPQAEPLVVDTTPAQPTVSKAAPTKSPRPEARPDPSKQAQRQTPRDEAQPQTARKAEQTTEARAEQKAAGTGGTNQAGSSTSRTASISQGQLDSLMNVWGSKIKAKIVRSQRYPRGENASGKVSLSLQVSRTGQLLGVRVLRSSGNARLDAAAIATVKRARRFAKAPRELTSNSYSFGITLELKPK